MKGGGKGNVRGNVFLALIDKDLSDARSWLK